MSSNLEFDSIFFTALRLLHSKAKSSSDQLKSLLDEVLSIKSEKKQQEVKNLDYLKNSNKESTKKPSRLIDNVLKNKKIKLSLSPSSSSPNLEAQAKNIFLPKTEIEEPVEITKIEDDSEATDIEEESTDAGEFALEMGLVCVVCKQIDFTHGNQPVECSECHNLYHQECHKPPITERDVSDPRNIWYCAKCTKNLEKMSKKTAKGAIKSPILTNSASFQSAVNSGRETAFQLIKAAKAESAASSSNLMQPFKRVEIKAPQSSINNSASNNNSFVQTKPIGLAGLAANLNRTATNSSASTSITSTLASTNSSNNGNNGGSVGNGNSNISSSLTLSPVSSSAASSINTLSKADKRIQQMKKKAAAKKILLK